MIIIGHRGCFYETENTIKSFLKAFEIGADGIEVDVQKTLDDKIVLSHDSNLRRVFEVDFDIRKNNYNSLKNLNLKENIPSLEEVLEFVRDKNKFIDVEIKNPDDFKFTLDIIKKFDYKEVIVSSFYHNKIFEFKKIYPEINFAYLFVHVPKNIDEYLKDVQFIKPNINYIVDYYKNFSLRIIPWVVNEYEEIELIKNLNPFGVITDFPDRFLIKSSKNTNLSYLLKTILKEESKINEDYLELKLVNSFIDLHIEKIETDGSLIKIEKEYPFKWNLGEKITIKVKNYSKKSKIKIKIKEFGIIEFGLDELIKLLT
ncbi:MAG: glycerophosphodiester phosphodiesterase family protein [Caldisericia bacterium]|nr:glycerophosphodiester phosphodiesterase family protein [Caldisericia bacterium]